MPRPGPRRPAIVYRDSQEAIDELTETAEREGISRSELMRRRLARAVELERAYGRPERAFHSQDEPDAPEPPAAEEGDRWHAHDGEREFRDGRWVKLDAIAAREVV